MKKFLFLLSMTVCGPLFAHPLDIGLLALEIQGKSVQFSLEFNPAAAAGLLGTNEQDLSVSTAQAKAELLLKETLLRDPLTAGASVCALQPEVKTELIPTALRLTGSIRCPEEAATLSWNLIFVEDARLPSTFQLMVRTQGQGVETLQLIERGKTEWKLAQSGSFSFGTFIKMGIDHIGVSPSQWWDESGLHLPEGIDHILFVVVLVLCGGTLWQLIATATGFTLGHSLTLTIASLGWVQIPSAIVESLIALSIAYLALEAILQKTPKYRWVIALFFGLIHGLGFATAIAELHVSGATLVKALIGFNLGVEIGQAIIILLLYPLLTSVLRKRPETYRQTQRALSGLIGLLGVYWFIERAFF